MIIIWKSIWSIFASHILAYFWMKPCALFQFKYTSYSLALCIAICIIFVLPDWSKYSIPGILNRHKLANYELSPYIKWYWISVLLWYRASPQSILQSIASSSDLWWIHRPFSTMIVEYWMNQCAAKYRQKKASHILTSIRPHPPTGQHQLSPCTISVESGEMAAFSEHQQGWLMGYKMTNNDSVWISSAAKWCVDFMLVGVKCWWWRR